MYRRQATPAGSDDLVRRQATSLLNKLVSQNFDSISAQIIAVANRPNDKGEHDGRALEVVVDTCFDAATSQPMWSDLHVRFCRALVDGISPDVRDERLPGPKGRTVAGRKLVRRYLLHILHEDLDKGWDPDDVEGKKTQNYIALIRFMGENFKTQMCSNRTVHWHAKKLLTDVKSPPRGTEIEAVCIFLQRTGVQLETGSAWDQKYLDAYFFLIRQWNLDVRISPRHRFMLQDLIDLRTRKWVPRKMVSPKTIPCSKAEARQQTIQDDQPHERMPGGPQGAEGKDTPRPPSKAGDLSNFGKIRRGLPMPFRPSSVFAGKKENKRETLPTSSSQNASSMITQVRPMPSLENLQN
ncbi:armadillo-type protein [Mycena rosella]|uniref:Armadillo-type protein n=1 Tax=Mycena rosella TaxID=1033263 RepID=A0AAD7DPX4_MYCRO|nr:armadillo-type protein [Mycena rosella]